MTQSWMGRRSVDLATPAGRSSPKEAPVAGLWLKIPFRKPQQNTKTKNIRSTASQKIGSAAQLLDIHQIYTNVPSNFGPPHGERRFATSAFASHWEGQQQKKLGAVE